MNENIFFENKVVLEDLVFHDCKIYGIGFNTANNELFIDIDFIEEWINEKNSNYYSFILIPSTLIFENVWDLNMDISTDLELIIDNIERFNPCTPPNIDYLPEFSKEYDWKIELIQGEINFKSIGMKIYQRGKKVKQKSQTLEMENRGGITLEKKGLLRVIH